MTQKEIDDLAIDFCTFFHEHETKDVAEVANDATEMIRSILERYPKIRYEIWQWNQEYILDTLGLDYGKP